MGNIALSGDLVATAKIKISIILPVYNGEKFLSETLNSILSQTFKDYELIIVNDGSKDESEKIVEQYMDKYEQIRLINQNNLGICVARNKGISVARGDYLMFCDHDDIFCDGYLEAAYKTVTDGDFDFVKFSCEELYFTQNKLIRSNVCLLEEKEYRGANILELILQYTNYNEYIWDGIYSKKLIWRVGCFDTKFLAGCEDIDIMLKIISAASSCKTNRAIMYKHYIRNAFSTSRRYSMNTYLSIKEMYDKRIELVQSQIEKIMEEKNNSSSLHLVSDYKQYEKRKTEQFVYALLGMFSFTSCNLSFFQIRREFRYIRNTDKLKIGIEQVKIFPATKYSACTFMFKIRFYSMLALMSVLKRRVSK